MFHKFIEYSKDLDMFKAPVKINLPGRRNRKSGEKEFTHKRGSFIGFVLTLGSTVLVMMICGVMILRMYSFQLDVT